MCLQCFKTRIGNIYTFMVKKVLDFRFLLHEHVIINGLVQEWTGLSRIGDPETRLHPVAPQASAVHSRAASFQT